MITTRPIPRSRRLLVATLLLSAVIHLVGGALAARSTHGIAYIMHRLPEQHPREVQVATSDVVTLERRTVPRPATRARAAPPPQVAKPTPRAPAVAAASAAARTVATPAPHELARVAVHAPPQPQRATPRPRARVAVAPHVVPTPHAVATLSERIATRVRLPSADRAALSSQQIAQLDRQFAQTIAATRTDLATVQKREESRPVTTRRMPLQFAGAQGTLTHGQGYISPTTPGRRVGDTVWYYTRYIYMWPDGHLESGDIPWPFHFPVDDDPFARHETGLIPIQPPPPGFRIVRPLQPLLAHFIAQLGAG